MASPGRGSARRGADFERRVCRWLADVWGLAAERVKAGRAIDDGDVVWPGSDRLHVDCKSRKAVPLSLFDEVESEAVLAGRVPVMVVDRVGTSDVGRSLVVLRLVDCQDLFAC